MDSQFIEATLSQIGSNENRSQITNLFFPSVSLLNQMPQNLHFEKKFVFVELFRLFWFLRVFVKGCFFTRELPTPSFRSDEGKIQLTPNSSAEKP